MLYFSAQTPSTLYLYSRVALSSSTDRCFQPSALQPSASCSFVLALLKPGLYRSLPRLAKLPPAPTLGHSSSDVSVLHVMTTSLLEAGGIMFTFPPSCLIRDLSDHTHARFSPCFDQSFPGGWRVKQVPGFYTEDMCWIRGLNWTDPMPGLLVLFGVFLSAPALLLAETLEGLMNRDPYYKNLQCGRSFPIAEGAVMTNIKSLLDSAFSAIRSSSECFRRFSMVFVFVLTTSRPKNTREVVNTKTNTIENLRKHSEDERMAEKAESNYGNTRSLTNSGKSRKTDAPYSIAPRFILSVTQLSQMFNAKHKRDYKVDHLNHVINNDLYYDDQITMDGCGQVVRYEESGTLTSKNYPGTYPNYTLCELTIRVPDGKNLYVKLADLDIESHECESSYLKIYKGSSTTEYASYCGDLSTAPLEIFLDTNVATIRFESSLHVSGRGFLINYASSDHPDLITCLARANHYEDAEYSRYCPAGCRDVAGDISGDVAEGYRDTSLLCKAAVHAGVIADELGGQIQLSQLKGTSRYRGVLANGILSKDGSLSDRRFVFNSLDCRTSLTTVSRADQFLATSSWEWTSDSGETITWSPDKAQLNIPGASWASSHQSEREWLEIDFGEKRKITGIVTTGSTLPNFNFYVKSYKINYKRDGPKWRVYKGAISNEERLLEGNLNYLDQTRNNFIPPVVARYLRIVPQTWHQRIALKVELVGCSLAQNHNSSTHPMWKKTNFRNAKTPTKEDKTITEPIPSEEANLGWLIIVITVALVLVLFVTLAGIGICILQRKRAKTNAYKSTDEQKGGCWKQLEQPFVRQQSTEFTISYSNNDKDVLPKFDLVKCDMEDYQQSLMIGTGLVTRKGSTFKPMDTEMKDSLGSQEIENHYDCPHSRNMHEYALPLNYPEPEYATPIIERHIIRENVFMSESGYNVPVVSLNRNSFSAASFSISSPENSGGDYQTPQRINIQESEYDKPKVHNGWATMDTSDYQKPPFCSLVGDGYSSPRDCLKPINQTAITSLL
ncbi:discoidin, CUB and LCCL domain-containing protein 1 [Pelodytes ibericus]